MKILYHILHPTVNDAARWIYEAWRDGFTALGYRVTELRSEHDFEKCVLQVKPDFFMTDISILDLRKWATFLEKIRSDGIKVAIWVHWPLADVVAYNTPFLINNSVADLYFGERESDQLSFLRDTGKNYVCIPHAANSLHHFPTPSDGAYASDILYIGSRLPHKRWFEKNVIDVLRRKKTYTVKVIGNGWTMADTIWRAGRKVAQQMRLYRLKNWMESHTVKITVDEERLYYSSAKICLNFHEREPDGSQPHYIVNQRTFKIPACGGFQICDEVPAIRKYFSDSEIVMLPLDTQCWLDTIDYYLRNDAERERIRANGTARALRDHMSVSRCKQLIGLLPQRRG